MLVWGFKLTYNIYLLTSNMLVVTQCNNNTKDRGKLYPKF